MKLNKLGVKNSLVNNINARKAMGISRPKSKSTIPPKQYSKMQKKKFNKAPKVSKFDTKELTNMVFDSIFDMEHTTTKETVGQMVSSTMTTAIELLKIVVENKVRNAEQITDKDIYDIYKKSFSAIIKAASMADDE